MASTRAAGQAAGEQPPGLPRWADLGGPVHYLDFGGPADGPLIICVHGLGGSAANWISLAPLLTSSYRVLAPDLAGHGLTRSAGRGTGVAANRELLHQFITTVASGPVILAGNSMGGMISLLEASAAPAGVAGLILIDPALPFVPARLDPAVAALFASYLPGVDKVLGTRRRRPATADELVARLLRLVCADPARIPPDVVARHVSVARQRIALPGAEADFTTALRSVVSTLGYPGRRGYRRRIRSLRCPVLLIHGSADRLVPVTAARAATRAAVRRGAAWTLAEVAGAGHVPQLEVPRETAALITGWLHGAGRAAAGMARPARLAAPAPPAAPARPAPPAQPTPL